jgi:hypothetical protein
MERSAGSRASFAFLICVIYILPQVTGSGASVTPALYALDGQFVETIDYTYSVNASRRSDGTAIVNLLKLQSLDEYGYHQQILSQEILESPAASSRRQYDRYQNFDCQYTELSWQDAPPTLTASTRASIRHTVDYRPFNTTSPFPVDSRLFSQDISPYLRSESQIQADDADIAALAKQLTDGSLCQMDAVVRVLNWVASNVRYGCPVGGAFEADASSTLRDRIGNCVNFANLATALLRAAGIPSVTSMGFVADRPESSSGHAWVAVLYPSSQWAEYESSFWMPTGGLVPETFLMSQHITMLAPPMSVYNPSPCNFTELHQASWTVLALPQKTQKVRVEAFHSEFICLPLVAESQGNQMLFVSWTEPKSGWAVSSSVRILNFSNAAVQSLMLTLSTPSTGDLSINMSVRLTTQGGQLLGEVTIEVVPSPTIQGLWPAPGSKVSPGTTIAVNYSSTRNLIDHAKTKLTLDGEDITSSSTLTSTGLMYVPSSGLTVGNHVVMVEVWDTTGSMSRRSWTFDVEGPSSDIQPLLIAAGAVGALCLGAVVICVLARKRSGSVVMHPPPPPP